MRRKGGNQANPLSQPSLQLFDVLASRARAGSARLPQTSSAACPHARAVLHACRPVSLHRAWAAQRRHRRASADRLPLSGQTVIPPPMPSTPTPMTHARPKRAVAGGTLTCRQGARTASGRSRELATSSPTRAHGLEMATGMVGRRGGSGGGRAGATRCQTRAVRGTTIGASSGGRRSGSGRGTRPKRATSGARLCGEQPPRGVGPLAL